MKDRYDTQVGYCQGLPFVAAVLLLHVGTFAAPMILFVADQEVDA